MLAIRPQRLQVPCCPPASTGALVGVRPWGILTHVTAVEVVGILSVDFHLLSAALTPNERHTMRASGYLIPFPLVLFR